MRGRGAVVQRYNCTLEKDRRFQKSMVGGGERDVEGYIRRCKLCISATTATSLVEIAPLLLLRLAQKEINRIIGFRRAERFGSSRFIARWRGCGTSMQPPLPSPCQSVALPLRSVAPCRTCTVEKNKARETRVKRPDYVSMLQSAEGTTCNLVAYYHVIAEERSFSRASERSSERRARDH